ncbi:MAG: glyoxalase superfamily protein [Isosphaeraceae bacterium]
MPEFLGIVPVLKVSDLDRSLAFYTGTLGFSLVWRSGQDGGGENAMLKAGVASLLLTTGTHLGDPPLFTGSLYFAMKEVDAYYDRLRGRVEEVWPLEAMEYGQREFGIRDPDGYMLAFAEDREEPA